MNVVVDVRVGKSPLFKPMVLVRDGNTLVVAQRSASTAPGDLLVGLQSLDAGSGWTRVDACALANVESVTKCAKLGRHDCVKVVFARGTHNTLVISANSPGHQRVLMDELLRARDEAVTQARAGDAESLSAVLGGGASGGASFVQVKGTALRAANFAPRFSVLLVPGLASSALAVVRSPVYPVGERLWINLLRLAAGRLDRMTSNRHQELDPRNRSAHLAPADSDLAAILGGGAAHIDERQEARAENTYLQHMVLGDGFSHDGVSDPSPHICVRAVDGLRGCAFLTEEKVTSSLSYVFGPLVQLLQSIGYKEGVDLMAAPYDWRLFPLELEARDKLFSRMAESVEKMAASKPVVIVAHSMGNRIAQLFLDFAERTKGRAWIDAHIYGFAACGAPWAGSPKTLRALTSGDLFGLDAFLQPEEGRELIRSCGSLLSLVPRNDDAAAWNLPWKSGHGFVQLTGDGKDSRASVLSVEETL